MPNGTVVSSEWDSRFIRMGQSFHPNGTVVSSEWDGRFIRMGRSFHPNGIAFSSECFLSRFYL